MRFDTLQLHPDIQRAIAEAGYEKCTPVQEQALPEGLAGRDIAAQAQTGTGKTAVFLLTIFQRLMDAGHAPGKNPKALILVPTRELAVQVYDNAKILGKNLPFRATAVFGGLGYNQQEKELGAGVDILIATPGRLMDFQRSRKVSLSDVTFFVMDEADRMLDMGFLPDIRYIASKLPPKTKRQTLLLSATLAGEIRKIASTYLNEPVEIDIDPGQITVDKVDQKIFHVSDDEKFTTLLSLLKREEITRAIVFTNMKITAQVIGDRLEENGVKCAVLTGNVDQKKRLRIVNDLKSGDLKILVATDVAARGLHVDDVSHVFNYDLPEDAENYVHRIGRTARAGKSGVAYSLACESLVLNLHKIEQYIERKIDTDWLDPSTVVEDKAGDYASLRRALRFGGRRRGGGRDVGRDGGQRRNGGGFSRDRSKPHAHPPKHAHREDRHGSPTRRSGVRSADEDMGMAIAAVDGFRSDAAKQQRPPRHDRGERSDRVGRGRGDSSRQSGSREAMKFSTEQEKLAYYAKKYGDKFGDNAPSAGSHAATAPKRHTDPEKQFTHPDSGDKRRRRRGGRGRGKGAPGATTGAATSGHGQSHAKPHAPHQGAHPQAKSHPHGHQTGARGHAPRQPQGASQHHASAHQSTSGHATSAHGASHHASGHHAKPHDAQPVLTDNVKKGILGKIFGVFSRKK